jgi:predicted RNA binding protein YcfA (HicA-like mRNA interferase family)
MKVSMKSAELLRKLKKVAKRRSVEFEIHLAKGSHHKVSLGGRSTIIAVHGTEIPSGTFRKILKDLDVGEEEV